jgi:antagonist of KipI
MPHLNVIRPGILTTVQDLGRWGRQGSGVPVAGPMDGYSHVLANRLVGNDERAAALEVTLMGPELVPDEDVICAVAGAAFSVAVNGAPVLLHAAFRVPAGARLRLGQRSAGARATLAVRGGFDVQPQFGSRATSLISRMGPFEGRPLIAGDVLPVGEANTRAAVTAGATGNTVVPLQLPRGGARLRVIRGPHEMKFTQAAFEALFNSRYVVTSSSNRMGYRLEGTVLTHSGKADILSDATPIGSIQVPASGQPILLMADRQTTGGYPKIATVITADLPLAGQLAPGDWIEFSACSRSAALDALRRQRGRLEGRAR